MPDLEAHKRVVIELLEAFSRNDAARAEAAMAEDFVNHDPPNLPGVGRDRAGVIAATKYLHSAFSNARAEIVLVVADGDKVAVHDRLCGRHTADFMGVAATGREVDVDFIHVFRVADGKITDRWGVADGATLLKQLGQEPGQEA